jgi:hypothetical protein
MKWLFTRAVSLVALSLSALSRRRSNWSAMAKTVEGIWPCIPAMVFASLMLHAGTGMADEWAGVGLWQGQIGDQQVTACFNDAGHGAYYDQKEMRLVTMISAGANAAVWKEEARDQGGGQWNAVAVSGSTLSARRSDLMVTLKRIGPSGCFNPAFDAPREKLSAPQAGAPRDLDGRTWRPVVAKGLYIPSFELDTAELLDPSPGIAAINAELRRVIPATQAAVADFFSCNRNQFGMYPQDGEVSVTLEPTLWTDELIGVRKIKSWSCGGAHPDFDQGFFLWNARKGEAIDVATWFKDGIVRHADPGKSHEVGKALADTIVAHLRGDGRCIEEVRETKRFDVAPGHRAMIFVPSGVARAMRVCEDEIVVPYDRLKPFLTDEGAAIVGRL